MKIAIVGYGKQGVSSYEYWKNGNEITIRDQSVIDNPPQDAVIETGPKYLENLGDFDLIIRSPKVYPDDLVKQNGPEILKKVSTNTNEFFRVCPTKNIIGVTGTKGKGTTSTLITNILRSLGKRVVLGGNIGIPPLDLLKENITPEDYVVLELANFQLIDLRYSPCLAVCLMVAPEHLDWHTDMNDYVTSKKQLFIHQTSHDIAIYFSNNRISEEIVSAGPAKKIPYFNNPGALIEDNSIKIEGNTICNLSELKLPGKHNLENICAAITAAWQVDKNVNKIRDAVIGMVSLPHRIEYLKTINQIKFYNDSFASVTNATIAAIESIPGKKVIIVGGFDRMLPLDYFVSKVKDNLDQIRKIVLIGESSSRVSEELTKNNLSNFILSKSKDIKEILNTAIKQAEPGDSVVLSPGFPSFDMFKDFEERGEKYKDAVNSL